MPRSTLALTLSAVGCLFGTQAMAAVNGQVLSGNTPIAQSQVTLWAATAGKPQQLAQAKTDKHGHFELPVTVGPAASLYLTAEGGNNNPAISLLSVVGEQLPAKLVINEMTTVASVWTHNQFIKGTAIQGLPLQLKIAAGNVPSFVNLTTGGWGSTILDPLNSSQTPTMANFATLASVLAGCVTQVSADACSKLFAAAQGPVGAAPADTLSAAQSIAKNPWYQPGRVFALMADFYPAPKDKIFRMAPYMPYLNFAPSAWVLPLKYTGGGYIAGGKAMFDSEGSMWVGNNFIVGEQAQDDSWNGNASKFDGNGKPLSPHPMGFGWVPGGGIGGPGFGTAIDAQDNVWFTSYAGKSISKLDKNGNYLTPPGEGITFGGKLGKMQGVIVTPSGDVWALGLEKSQLVFFPKGDHTKGRIVCEGKSAEPCKSFKLPFHLAIDQQDRIWVGNGAGDHITRFPASDPTKAENFTAGYSPSGMNVDSQGNVWVANRFGNGVRGLEKLAQIGILLALHDNYDKRMAEIMFAQKGGPDGGSVTLFKPDGTQFTGSPFNGESLSGPWAVVVSGDDTVWVSNFTGAAGAGRIAHLCGVKTENCPPGMKTGDPISPPGGYQGGGLQMQTDLSISPTGDVWVIDNWENYPSCFPGQPEGLSTRCGGQGVTVFHGMAKPVRTPQIGPAQPL
jgi:streptogramin lyase